MYNRQQLLDEIKISTQKVIQILSEFPEELFNLKPAPEKWSAAETAEHLVVVEGLILSVVNGKKVYSDGREICQKRESIKAVFGDFEKKLTAPEPIQPKGLVSRKSEVIETFSSLRGKQEEALRNLDLSMVCEDFSHRVFGNLTVCEWISFIIAHSERHLHQVSLCREILELSRNDL